MRPTITIICDVTDGKPVTDEEAKMALMAMSSISHLVEHALRMLSKAVLQDKPSAKFLAREAETLLSTVFYAKKKDPLEWLGPANTPGTPEHAERQSWGRKLFKKATGLDIDDPRSFEEQKP